MQQDPLQNEVEEDYNEEEDSDFNEGASDDGSQVSSSDGDSEQHPSLKTQTGGKSAAKDAEKPLIEELDSGDEVTIKERQKARKKQKRRKATDVSSDEGENAGWRAKTRSMRVQEQEERQKKSLASIKTSTIDVNRLWVEINKPGPLPPVRVAGEVHDALEEETANSKTAQKPESAPAEETITIKRQFKFAGEVHVEEKVVPKSSAEAQLWLAQQEHSQKEPKEDAEGRQRPLRKVSRFDPNYSNHEAFRNLAIKAQPGTFKGPKLNVVEKSKMDWATHVDSEGLQDELAVHAKAKDAYLNRMDFLSQVEQRKEEEARLARQKG